MLTRIFSKKKNEEFIRVCPSNNSFSIDVEPEYPFNLSSKALRIKVNEYIKYYTLMYIALELKIYLRFQNYEKGRDVNIRDVYAIIQYGKNELSRRTNENIIKWTFGIAIITVIICTFQLGVTFRG